MFDELLDAKKSQKNNIVETSEDEDTVPMANNYRKNPLMKEMKTPVFDDIEESDDEDEEEDEAMDTEDEGSGKVSETEDKDSEVTDFQKKISEMSMAQIKALRGKLGTKLFDKLLAESQQTNDIKEEVKEESDQEEEDEHVVDENPNEESSKKKSRHAPREMSSKKPVSVHRTIDPNAINYSKRKFDPRFSERAGTYHESEFRNDYGFIDDLRKNDIQKLNAAMKQAKSKKEKEKIKDLIGRLKAQQNSVEERDLWRQTKNELLSSNIDRMNQGLKPVFVNNKQMKERFKEKKLGKIEETRGKKGLEKYLKKKEKRESKKKLL